MRINELRDILEKNDPKIIQKAFCECYKMLPKAKKEEFDLVLKDILAGKSNKKEKSASVNYDVLEQEIIEFIQNAYAGNYYIPNRTIPKNKRSKWRFLVKDYIKALAAVKPDHEFFSKACHYLVELYKLICTACNVYLFSTEDAFRSIGMEQTEFYNLVIDRIYTCYGHSEQAMKDMMLLATTGGLSRESLHEYQMSCFVHYLPNSDLKQSAMQIAKESIKEIEEKLEKDKKGNRNTYAIRDAINKLDLLVLWLSLLLGTMEEEMDYFFTHSKEYNDEITLFVGLDLLSTMDMDEEWIAFYEYGVMKKHIKPREYIKEKYLKLTNNKR